MAVLGDIDTDDAVSGLGALTEVCARDLQRSTVWIERSRGGLSLDELRTTEVRRDRERWAGFCTLARASDERNQILSERLAYAAAGGGLCSNQSVRYAQMAHCEQVLSALIG